MTPQAVKEALEWFKEETLWELGFDGPTNGDAVRRMRKHGRVLAAALESLQAAQGERLGRDGHPLCECGEERRFHWGERYACAEVGKKVYTPRADAHPLPDGAVREDLEALLDALDKETEDGVPVTRSFFVRGKIIAARNTVALLSSKPEGDRFEPLPQPPAAGGEG